MRVHDNSIFLFKNISCLSLLAFLIISSISLNVLVTPEDFSVEKIEMKKDIESENENSEQENSDSQEIDEYYQQCNSKDSANLYLVMSIAGRNNTIDLQHFLDISTPPPE